MGVFISFMLLWVFGCLEVVVDVFYCFAALCEGVAVGVDSVGVPCVALAVSVADSHSFEPYNLPAVVGLHAGVTVAGLVVEHLERTASYVLKAEGFFVGVNVAGVVCFHCCGSFGVVFCTSKLINFSETTKDI